MDFEGLLERFWVDFEANLDAKTPPKSTKNRKKMDIEIDQNFACILSGLLVALGANMAEKASQKGAGGFFGLFFGLGGVLGGSWGLLGPKS